MDDGTVAVQPPTADTSATSVEPESDEKTGPSQHEGSKMEGEGDTVPTQEPELKQKRWRRSKDENGKREMREVETAMDQETEEERKARIEEELASLEEEIAEASSAVNLRPLGVDRHHRRYWIFPSLPGLFVEDTGHFPTEEAAQPVKSETPPELQVELPMARPFLPHSAIVSPTKATPTKRLPPPLIHIDNIQASKLLDMDSPSPEKEDKAQSQTPESEEVLTPSAVQQQQQAHAAQSNHLSWSCFTTTEDVDSLISSLNPRGQREVELKKSLESQRSVVLQGITRCPFRPNTTSRSSPSPQQKYCNADEYLELYLREQILDIEEKIYVGNLGYMKDVKDRSEWREAIETSGAAATQSLASTLEAPPQPSIASRPESPAPEDGGRTKSGIATPLVNPAVQELSRALLSVQGGIEKKYLMPPLGFAVDEKQKQKQKGSKKNGVVKGSRICLDQWRASLAKATSFSQIFVHLATLERAVMWSRSLMNMRCRICRRKGGDEYMLLCDGCDHGYHTYCLRPPLLSVPRGDWFCNNCRPVTPVKPR